MEHDAIIADLVESPAANVTVEGMAARLVADQIAFVTYETVADDRRVSRTSWWRERDGTWRCFFHQGTVAAPSLYSASPIAGYATAVRRVW